MPLKILIKIEAGVIVGQPMQEFSKSLHITDQDLATNDPDFTAKVYGKAAEYLHTLCDPNCFNWVQYTWIYM